MARRQTAARPGDALSAPGRLPEEP